MPFSALLKDYNQKRENYTFYEFEVWRVKSGVILNVESGKLKVEL